MKADNYEITFWKEMPPHLTCNRCGKLFLTEEWKILFRVKSNDNPINQKFRSSYLIHIPCFIKRGKSDIAEAKEKLECTITLQEQVLSFISLHKEEFVAEKI